MLALDCTQSLASVTCLSQQGENVRHENFFCVNAFLRCSSVSSPMQAIYSCRAIRRHFLRLSDCLTSFTLLFLTLPLFLMVHASTLSAILYSAAAAGNLISASSSCSAHESSDLNSSASDALLVAHLPEKFRQYEFSHSSCQVLFCLCSMWLVESIAEHISFCLLSYSSIRCARPLSRHIRFMVTSVLRRSFNSRQPAQFIHVHHLVQRGSRF